MMRNIFITGRIHNISGTPLIMIQQRGQEDIDKLIGGHHVDFKINPISENEYEPVFFPPCNYHDILKTNLVWDVDAAIITGLRLDGCELLERWISLLSEYTSTSLRNQGLSGVIRNQ